MATGLNEVIARAVAPITRGQAPASAGGRRRGGAVSRCRRRARPAPRRPSCEARQACLSQHSREGGPGRWGRWTAGGCHGTPGCRSKLSRASSPPGSRPGPPLAAPAVCPAGPACPVDPACPWAGAALGTGGGACSPGAWQRLGSLRCPLPWIRSPPGPTWIPAREGGPTQSGTCPQAARPLERKVPSSAPRYGCPCRGPRPLRAFTYVCAHSWGEAWVGAEFAALRAGMGPVLPGCHGLAALPLPREWLGWPLQRWDGQRKGWLPLPTGSWAQRGFARPPGGVPGRQGPSPGRLPVTPTLSPARRPPCDRSVSGSSQVRPQRVPLSCLQPGFLPGRGRGRGCTGQKPPSLPSAHSLTRRSVSLTSTRFPWGRGGSARQSAVPEIATGGGNRLGAESARPGWGHGAPGDRRAARSCLPGQTGWVRQSLPQAPPLAGPSGVALSPRVHGPR